MGLNTIILLSSGIRVTWAHKRFDCRFHDQRILSLIITTFLGAYFTGLQAIEYLEATFSIADSIYGSTFYIATGSWDSCNCRNYFSNYFLHSAKPRSLKHKSPFWSYCFYLILTLCRYCVAFFVWLDLWVGVF